MCGIDCDYAMFLGSCHTSVSEQSCIARIPQQKHIAVPKGVVVAASFKRLALSTDDS